jgi:hypothetical protein
MRLAVLSLLSLSFSCFQEPPADRVWRCSVDKPQCPEGQSCVNDWCVKDGTAMPDLANSDGSTSADMSMVPCTDGFPIGTKGAWACRGKFSAAATVASALCKNGYKPCTNSNLISDAECSSSSLGGFFFADALGTGASTLAAKCATGTGAGWGSLIFGCGSTVQNFYERSTFGCRGFFPVAYCNATNPCNFNDGRLDAQSTTDARNGVLCCPP